MRFFAVVSVVVCLALQYKYWFGKSGYFEVRILADQVEQQVRLNDQLRERNRVLRAEVDGFRDGLEAVEAHARSDLGMVVEGETFYLVVEPANDR
ncbi:MAG: septum formation initiator family protein [Pseudomonadales bacterium]|nr:septum formation initiator family protein [Pseudomonadales bacterium]